MSRPRARVPMEQRLLSRRDLLRWGLGAVAGGALALRGGDWLAAAQAQALPSGTPIRVGLVVPGKTGNLAVDAAQYDIVGDASRNGAVWADGEVGQAASAAGQDFRLLAANSPSAEAAVRAAERLVSLEEVGVLIGGLGVGQAEALAGFAKERGVLFFNIGSTADGLRDACDPGLVFHFEASQAMLLDAAVAWHAGLGRRRWFLIEDLAESGGVEARLRLALERHGMDGSLVGSAHVREGQPVYHNEVQDALDAGADMVLVSVGLRDEILLRYTLSDLGFPGAVMALPTSATQTRDFIAASRAPTPAGVADHRLLNWEPTLRSGAAAELNDRGNSRLGQPFDPAGWATFDAVRAYYQAVVASGSVEPEVVRRTLIDPDFQLISAKGAGVGFRPWDQQLRQPMYVVTVDHEARWGLQLSQRLAVAQLTAIWPDDAEAEDPVAMLDRFGDGPADARC